MPLNAPTTFNMTLACAGGQDEAYALRAVREDCEWERNDLSDVMYSFSLLRHAESSRVSVPVRCTMTSKQVAIPVPVVVDSKERRMGYRARVNKPELGSSIVYISRTIS
jgi:hypothetical protein